MKHHVHNHVAINKSAALYRGLAPPRNFSLSELQKFFS